MDDFVTTAVPPLVLMTMTKATLKALSGSSSGNKKDLCLRLDGVTWADLSAEAVTEIAAKAHVSRDGKSLREVALEVTQRSLGQSLEIQTDENVPALAVAKAFVDAFNGSPDTLESGRCALAPGAYLLRYQRSAAPIFSQGAYNIKRALLAIQRDVCLVVDVRPDFAKVHATPRGASVLLWCRLDYRHAGTLDYAPQEGALLQLDVDRHLLQDDSSVTDSGHILLLSWEITVIKLGPAPAVPGGPTASRTRGGYALEEFER